MLENKDPSLNLKDVFDQVFYPGIQSSYEELLAYTDQFYTTEFPKLRSLTNQIPDSRQIVEYALSNGLEVVIATNPLYPKSAVEQRLAWAELAVDQFDYTLITSYENSHFAKPNLEYYAEILAKLGRNPHDAVMIGNDISDDIDPARALGIATFHISADTDSTSLSGTLSQALDWLKGMPEIIDPRTSATPQSLSARLMGNLVAFGALLSERNEQSWTRKPTPDSWAAIEVIAHLRDVEIEINTPRIKSILVSDEPFLSAVDSDSWADERGYIDSNPMEVLESLWQARMETITLLDNQSPDVWKRSARHAIFGPTNLAELVLIFIEHDLLHLRQLRTTLNPN
jgi:phosphoglycolate phosphatase-like HAD superfamily hydrolase